MFTVTVLNVFYKGWTEREYINKLTRDPIELSLLISPIKVQKTETTAQEPPSSPSQTPARVSESPKIPHVELRHVGTAKSNRPVSAPPMKLVIPPPPPSDPPPPTPPPGTPPPPALLKTNGSPQKGSYWVTLSTTPENASCNPFQSSSILAAMLPKQGDCFSRRRKKQLLLPRNVTDTK